MVTNKWPVYYANMVVKCKTTDCGEGCGGGKPSIWFVTINLGGFIVYIYRGYNSIFSEDPFCLIQ